MAQLTEVCGTCVMENGSCMPEGPLVVSFSRGWDQWDNCLFLQLPAGLPWTPCTPAAALEDSRSKGILIPPSCPFPYTASLELISWLLFKTPPSSFGFHPVTCVLYSSLLVMFAISWEWLMRSTQISLQTMLRQGLPEQRNHTATWHKNVSQLPAALPD